MQIGHVTTPFGRRPMTLAMLASQAQDVDPEKSIDKWKLYRAVCEARTCLCVTDRGLALLNALLTFYPAGELSCEFNLVVFPSNTQLSARAHGMSEPTMRRHLAVLVDAGLIARKDSANGKRFARRDRAGEVDEAFGFSLAPLLARADEIEILADEIASERLQLQRMRERLTVCRRDIAKLIDAALEEGASGDWAKIHAQFRGLVTSIPRSPSFEQVAEVLDEMELLRDEIVNVLEMQVKTENMSANPLQNDRHIQNSNSESIIESEPLKEIEKGQMVAPVHEPRSQATVLAKTKENLGGGRRGVDVTSTIRAFPLGMILQACPQIIDYGPGGAINSWRDLMGAAVVVRSMLGVSPSAYQQACEVLGAENAATVMACVLERAGHINSAGGYIRNLTERASNGEFALGPMLMALMRSNAGASKKVG